MEKEKWCVAIRAKALKEKIEEQIALGNGVSRAARSLGMANGTIAKYAKELGLYEQLTAIRNKQGQPQDKERDNEIKTMREQGKTLNEIAKELGITRQRVHQIVLRACPDFVVAKKEHSKICPICGTEYSGTAKHCSRECFKESIRTNQSINRDYMVRVMELRKEGKIWSEVQEIMDPDKTINHFILEMSRRSKTICSTNEREWFFNHKTDKTLLEWEEIKP